jgi:hypothetical protein
MIVMSIIENAKKTRTVKLFRDVSAGLTNLLKRGKVTEWKASLRMEICNSCDKNEIGICRSCGCVLALKVRANENSCPEGKWGSYSLLDAHREYEAMILSESEIEGSGDIVSGSSDVNS